MSEQPESLSEILSGVARRSKDRMVERAKEFDRQQEALDRFYPRRFIAGLSQVLPTEEMHVGFDAARANRLMNQAFGHPVRDYPQIIDRAEVDKVLNWAFFANGDDPSELAELLEALANNDLVGIADAIGDIIEFLLGLAGRHGIYMAPVQAEIHRSNMSKLDENGNPIYGPDGKVQKGPNYSPPDIRSILIAQGMVVDGEAEEQQEEWP